MRKILSILVIFIITISTTFWYSPTSKDEKLLNSVYIKLDSILEKTPSKIENLYKKITKIKEQVKNKERIYYILIELENYSYEILTDRNNVEYTVKEVIDWDTIKISYLWKESNVRFIWIDTPESYATRFWYKECYWDEAKEYLKNLIEWKKIKLEVDNTQWKTDKYNRLLWYVIYDWENINNKLIEEWYAWEYTYNKAYKYQDLFKTSETEADKDNKWLWASDSCNWERLSVDSVEDVDNSEEEDDNLEDLINELNDDDSTTTNSSSSNSTIRTYIRWERWGCYYINSNWNKTYVDHSYCY